MSKWAGAGEFAMLADRMSDYGRRLDAIDQGGTRGVAVLAAQIAEVIKDVADLRQELRDHDRTHQEEKRGRIVSRRWVITAVIAVLTLVETPLILILTGGHG